MFLQIYLPIGVAQVTEKAFPHRNRGYYWDVDRNKMSQAFVIHGKQQCAWPLNCSQILLYQPFLFWMLTKRNSETYYLDSIALKIYKSFSYKELLYAYRHEHVICVNLEYIRSPNFLSDKKGVWQVILNVFICFF